MSSKIKNIIIYVIIGAILILVYIFFIKKSPEVQNLISSAISTGTTESNVDNSNKNSLIAKDFLALLLNVKKIKLNNSIFSNTVFINLHDSSILLSPSGDEGRSNPFAPIGYEAPSVLSIPASP
ncbi:MAG: hypothetical protein WC839_02855 [Candidatus Paceibacterota bacterium]